MDKAKEIMNDPAKLEQGLKVLFDKIDVEKKGFITFEAMIAALNEAAKASGVNKDDKLSKEEIDEGKKIADPDGTNKVTCENFIKFVKNGFEKAKAAGEI